MTSVCSEDDKEMIAIENSEKQAQVCMSNEQSHGTCNTVSSRNYMGADSTSELQMKENKESAEVDSIRQNKKVQMRKQLVEMLSDSCILL